ncbi:MAG: molecular chaperone DnaJ, partial [Clostridia bacterium]|nr:molecular chaperone DnaJ [Clostridia bacterium]
LSALAQTGLHNNAQAMEYARQAVSMEPGNMQYQQLLSRLQSGGMWYGQRGTTYGRQTHGQPNLCLSFLMLQMLCTCCSGGSMCYYPLCCCI